MANERIGWGILGTGNIANAFVSDLGRLPNARFAAVGSRAIERAEVFAEKYSFERAYGSYRELMEDPDVDIIYVATPHPFHCDNTIACLEHGKAVLCEKPMAINERQEREMVATARERGLFLMEAMWTRCLPVTRAVQRWVDEGRIGDVRMLKADFGFRAAWNPEGRLLNPDLGGGALLDVGVYMLAYASMVFGSEPCELTAAADIGETGVDEQTAVIAKCADGALALLACAVRTNTPQEARIMGTQGSIIVPAFWRATSATLSVDGEDPVSITETAGYHYEAAEAMACLQAGKTESPLMPLDESLAIAGTMDRVRRLIGVRYPMEA
jgi:predicted dehydrogenase